MTHLALYRSWRPRVFDEVVEQKHVVYALRQAVISRQIAHAYLFSGTRGTGKTTLAKIFSRAINCLEPEQGNPCNQCVICRGILDGSLLDVVEMDAASNNSVDNIRRVCDEVLFMPSQARYKVYIIDEVHMLSTGAFNALLKTLEEPPAHAVFILATTEPHRIPATILSRCQRYDFRRIPLAGLTERLAEIAAADQISITAEALETIAGLADGAMRDAISLLDQARSSCAGTIARDDVLALVGVVQDTFMQQMAEALHTGDPESLLSLVEQLVMDGRDIARFVQDLAQHFRNILVCQVSERPELLARVSAATLADMQSLSRKGSPAEWIALIQGLSALLSDLRWASDTRTTLEIGLIRLMGQRESSKDDPPAKGAARQKKASFGVKPVVPADRPKPDTDRPASSGQDDTAGKPAAASRISGPREEEAPLPEPPPEEDDQPGFGQTSEPEPEKAEKPRAAIVPEPDTDSEQPEKELDPGQLWQQMSEKLQVSGHMTLYLFSRPARPSLDGDKLKLSFAAEEHVHLEELSKPESQKILNELARIVSGCQLEVLPTAIEDSSGDQPAAAESENGPSWISQVRKTADELGIPMKMEE